MTQRKKIKFGIIGLGMMGREFSSSLARWCYLLDDGPEPVIKGICDKNEDTWKWYTDNFPGLIIKKDDYKMLV